MLTRRVPRRLAWAVVVVSAAVSFAPAASASHVWCAPGYEALCDQVERIERLCDKYNVWCGQ